MTGLIDEATIGSGGGILSLASGVNMSSGIKAIFGYL